MCETFFITCRCGEKQAELFFGKMLLGRNSVKQLFCPECSGKYMEQQPQRIHDNGWVLELEMDTIRPFSSTFGMAAESLTAEWIFDSGYVTWAGITPDDSRTRNQEREKIQELAKTDVVAYIAAMKKWGKEREQRFIAEGWRKMGNPSAQG